VVARRLTDPWIVGGFAALLLVLYGLVVGVGALVLNRSLRGSGTVVQAPEIARIGGGVTGGHAWTLTGSRTMAVRCMRLEANRSAATACFGSGADRARVGVNSLGRLVFGQVPAGTTAVQLQFRHGAPLTIATLVSESGVLDDWRYYVAAIPRHRSLRAVEPGLLPGERD
jgi:hypothetical protein